jgi:hypothetical protein
MAISSSGCDAPALAGNLGEIVVGVAGHRNDGGAALQINVRSSSGSFR